MDHLFLVLIPGLNLIQEVTQSSSDDERAAPLIGTELFGDSLFSGGVEKKNSIPLIVEMVGHREIIIPLVLLCSRPQVFPCDGVGIL